MSVKTSMFTSCPADPHREDFDYPDTIHGSSEVGWDKVEVSSVNDACVSMATGVQQMVLVYLFFPIGVNMQEPYHHFGL